MSVRVLPAANIRFSFLSVSSLYDLESEGDEPNGRHSIKHPVRGQGKSREVGEKASKHVYVAPLDFPEARYDWEGKQEGIEFWF